MKSRSAIVSALIVVGLAGEARASCPAFLEGLSALGQDQLAYRQVLVGQVGMAARDGAGAALAFSVGWTRQLKEKLDPELSDGFGIWAEIADELFKQSQKVTGNELGESIVRICKTHPERSLQEATTAALGERLNLGKAIDEVVKEAGDVPTR